MKSPRPLRLVMAPLVACLSLAALDAASAAPAKKPAAPTAPIEAAPPVQKRSLLGKLNPFQKKAPAPPVAPLPAQAKNSKKTALAAKASPMPVPRPAMVSQTPPKASANSKFLPPTRPSLAAEPEPPPKPGGFFSRLKAKLAQDPDAPIVSEKPARPADWKEHWVVTDDSTAFYEFGPSQSNGPDLRLPQGQVVKLTQSSRGWAKVELEGGRQGYIGTDQMRQAIETDFSSPILPAGTQLAAVGSGTGSSLQGWSPIAPPPDLPDLPMAAGMENSLLLLPPLEYDGTELKKSSLRLPSTDTPGPTFKPGDTLPAEAPAVAPEPPVLDLEKEKTPIVPSIPSPVEPAPVEPAPAKPAPAAEDPVPAPTPAVPTPPEPAAPTPEVPS